ncbi:CAP domain-containing protein [Pseudarthrobacter sp. P1]|uniref:CAP domain-containing protein n=1 Tax=Pseudarthrobacter sp. P1 TaxID=3418418 RepID=UPI003CEAB106
MAPQPLAVTADPANDSYARQVLDLLNDRRRAAGIPDLAWNQTISDVSQDWADKLATATADPAWEFADVHRPDAGGSMIPKGFDWYSEIIGFNSTPADIVQWWMDSSVHETSILNPLASDIGIGVAVPTSGPYAGWHLVVANLAGYPATRPPLPGVGAAAIAAKYAQVPSMGPAYGEVVCGMPAYGCYRMHGAGAIVGTPALGAHTSVGGIRQVWGAHGFEAGRLGYL